jgi:Immunoglobulin domain
LGILLFLLAVPPDILDYPTSTDMVVREGSNVTLKCAATGSPSPNITWRREGGEKIMLLDGSEGKYFVSKLNYKSEYLRLPRETLALEIITIRKETSKETHKSHRC